MKRPGNISMILAGLLLTAALTASCAKIRTMPDTTPQEIAMKCLETGTALPQTKAASALPVTASFGIFAYASEEAGETPWYEAWPAVADADPYLRDVAFGNIDYSWVGCDFDAGVKTHHPYYYPLSGSLLFAGYSPHQTQSGGTITYVTYNNNLSDVYNPYLQIKVSQSIVPSAMTDLMYFDFEDVNDGKTVAKSGDAVPVTFSHAMSMVVFNIKHHYHDVSANLHECIFNATFYSGTNPGWLPDTGTETVKDMTGLFGGDDNESEGYKQKSETLYLIPQYTNGHFDVMGSQIGGDIVLDVTVTDRIPKTENYIETSGKVEIKIKDYTPRWEMGKKYTYNITIDKPIEFGEPVVASVETLVIEL